MINIDFKSILELVKAFPDEQTCINHLEALRWYGNVVSPFDATSKVYKCAGNKYKCKNTGKYFNVRTATLFDNTKIELQTWFIAIYLLTGHKKGISSLQLSRDLNVTQKTAWFMAQRIRNCFGLTDENNEDKLGGEGVIVEADTSLIGGKAKNMHTKKRLECFVPARGGRANGNKTTVAGYLERGGTLRLTAIKESEFENEMLLKHVSTDSALMTDSANNCKKVGKNYAFHGMVDHSKDEYVNKKERHIHTNTIEGVFSLFDRMVIGIYHFVSKKHIQRYLNEFSFRYNSRTSTDCSRFNLLLSNCTNRLTYNALIAK